MTVLLILILLGQEPIQREAFGVFTGILRDSTGKGMANVRVAAMAKDQKTGTEVLVSIGRSGDTGEYRLEVPPGEYYILAGRVDKPTYYPGVSDLPSATHVPIHSGSSLNMDLTVFAASTEPITQPPRTLPAIAQIRLSLPARSAPSPLMVFLKGHANENGSAKFVLELARVTDRIVSFYREVGSFSYGCTSCSFFVTEGGVGPLNLGAGILFKLSPDGESLNFTCHATSCNVASAMQGGFSGSSMKRDESRAVSISDQVAFSVIP